MLMPHKRKTDVQLIRLRHLISFNDDEKFQSGFEFTVICACLDVIEDTQAAITGFRRTRNLSKVESVNYLRFYGLLQAIFTQQDAILELARLTGKPVDLNRNYKELEQGREVRNRTIGHPTDGLSKRNKPVAFLLRNTLSQTGFTFVTVGRNGHKKADEFNSTVLLSKQSILKKSVLKNAITFAISLRRM